MTDIKQQIVTAEEASNRLMELYYATKGTSLADACLVATTTLASQQARIAELEQQVAVPSAEGELEEGEQYLAWIPDDNEYQALTYWPSNPDAPFWNGATSYQMHEVRLKHKLTPPPAPQAE